MPDITMINSLRKLVSDYFALTAKLYFYHWNIKGPLFNVLHEKFSELYNYTLSVFDMIAERIEQLGGKPPMSLREHAVISNISDAFDTQDGPTMINDIIKDFNKLNTEMDMLALNAKQIEDSSTQLLLEDTLRAQEKILWMLRASL